MSTETKEIVLQMLEEISDSYRPAEVKYMAYMSVYRMLCEMEDIRRERASLNVGTEYASVLDLLRAEAATKPPVLTKKGRAAVEKSTDDELYEAVIRCLNTQFKNVAGDGDYTEHIKMFIETAGREKVLARLRAAAAEDSD